MRNVLKLKSQVQLTHALVIIPDFFFSLSLLIIIPLTGLNVLDPERLACCLFSDLFRSGLNRGGRFSPVRSGPRGGGGSGVVVSETRGCAAGRERARVIVEERF